MDLEKYVDKYSNVSREELQKIKDCLSVFAVDEMTFESKVRHVHEDRERVKIDGRPSLRPGPLVHVFSVCVQSETPLVLYGQISVEFCDPMYGEMVKFDLYKRDIGDAQSLGMSDTLTLNGPDYSCWPYHAYIPLFRHKIVVELFDGDQNLFVRKCLDLGDTNLEEEYEEVNSKTIHGVKGSLTLHYIAIPLGVHCRIEVLFSRRQGLEKEQTPQFINVNGKVVARYDTTYGNYASEGCILFEKKSYEFEELEIGRSKPIRLSRCWVALPAYSSLVVHVELSEFGNGRKLVDNTLQLIAQPGLMSGDSFVVDDFIVEMHVSWFSPYPFGPYKEDVKYQKACSSEMHPEHEDMEHDVSSPEHEDMEHDVSSPEREDMEHDVSSDDDVSSSNLNLPWTLYRHLSKPLPSPALEIFSVFVGREKSKAIQIYGSIEVVSDDHAYYIFKRGENDALGLLEDMKSTPVLDGSRVYEEFDSLEMKFDLKDIKDHLAIKGYVDWAASTLDSGLWRDKQLCSFIQGRHGFAVVHYSIFSRAVEANIKVYVELEMGTMEVYPKVYGSLCAQYSYYDYSSRYNKDYYRIVLLRKTSDDSIQLNADSTIPLARSLVVVPSYSSLIFDVDLLVGVSRQRLSCTHEILIGECSKIIKTPGVSLRMEIEWCEVK